MALPASENTTASFDAYVIREYGPAKHIKVTASAAYSQGDLVKEGPFCGVADEDIASSGTGTISVGCGIRVGAEITGTSQTFATWGQEVYFDTDDGKLYEADDATRYLIGYVTVVADSAGVFEIFLFDTVKAGIEAST